MNRIIGPFDPFSGDGITWLDPNRQEFGLPKAGYGSARMTQFPLTRKWRRTRRILEEVDREFDEDGYRRYFDEGGWEYYGTPEHRRYVIGRMKTGLRSKEVVCFRVYTDTFRGVYCDREGREFEPAIVEKIREWAGEWELVESPKQHFQEALDRKPTIDGRPAW